MRAVCTVMLEETWTSGPGSKPGLKPKPTSVRSCQTVTVLKRL